MPFEELLMPTMLRAPRGAGGVALRTAFANVDTDPVASMMIDMLNPQLKKMLHQHPEVINMFSQQVKSQLQGVQLDPDAMKALKNEMMADVKELNEAITKDPSILKHIENHLGGGITAASVGSTLCALPPPPRCPSAGASRARAQLTQSRRRTTAGRNAARLTTAAAAGRAFL
eukprot:TRINITY_DN50835_c0_g1_i1.p1 TRINITY_DN50835_c0_g1~~TRINITY_DN50835_c0_g1_i1.p1  ORF type:complete len:198 (-),score=56.64 TRINITY_DN50835_c0_g1_i1:77-595(-)